MRNLGRLVLLPPADATSDEPTITDHNTVIPKSVVVARYNISILLPVLDMVSVEPNLKLPCIDLLLAAVGDIYDKNRQDVPGSRVYQDAWGIRRLAQLVKSRLYKPNPPSSQESRLMILMY